MKKAKLKLTRLERLIRSKESFIKRLHQQIADENLYRDEVIKKLRARIKVKEYMLAGLKSGELQP